MKGVRLETTGVRTQEPAAAAKSHACCARGCGAAIERTRIMCPRHWELLPASLQKLVAAAWSADQRAEREQATPLRRAEVREQFRRQKQRAYWLVACAEGLLERHSPGVYVDPQEHVLELDLAELLSHHGFPDTPANRATLEESALAVFRQAGVPLEYFAPHGGVEA